MLEQNPGAQNERHYHTFEDVVPEPLPTPFQHLHFVLWILDFVQLFVLHFVSRIRDFVPQWRLPSDATLSQNWIGNRHGNLEAGMTMWGVWASLFRRFSGVRADQGLFGQPLHFRAVCMRNDLFNGLLWNQFLLPLQVWSLRRNKDRLTRYRLRSTSIGQIQKTNEKQIGFCSSGGRQGIRG